MTDALRAPAQLRLAGSSVAWVGWLTVVLGAAFLLVGWALDERAAGDVAGGVAGVATSLVRIAPWPLLLPLGIVQVLAGNRIRDGRRDGWPRPTAMVIAAAFALLSLLGVGASSAIGLVAKLAWIGANLAIVVLLARLPSD
ncbi:MAG TPA: hypothetical protein VHQ42_09355 [Candidatus Limnocylindria bacterium]|nr:hypothetical protein [Candidatus Limnocylindria bacterium]